MEIKKLSEWNPWWENQDLVKDLKGRDRKDYSFLVDSVKIKEITIILGVRRAGKSTLMYQMIDNLFSQGVHPKQILFINLEDKKLIKDSLEDIYSTYREIMNPKDKAYVFIDEVHRKEDWESWIRKKYDLKSNCKFIISGSCSYLLKKEYSTLLTGRNLTFEVFPLGFDEFLFFKGLELNKKNLEKNITLDKTKYQIINYLNQYISAGGFPEIFFADKNYKFKILKQYFDDILYKDIIDRHNINSQKIKDLALFLITNFTSKFSLRNIRNSLGISYDAIKDYLSYYTESFLFFEHNYFSYSLKEQKTRASKVYCIDNGLRNAVSFKFSKDEGKLAENLVFVELKRKNKEIYYWEDKAEVDFVVKEKNKLDGINVTYSDNIGQREINGLCEFKKKFGKRIRKLIIITKDLEQKKQGIEYIPLWKWLII
ncbi:MAG: ATP-binding protein [Nanoarchaeota archaeon]|nr:ATP-binding protein [Nanoarchaeota archaeon]